MKTTNLQKLVEEISTYTCCPTSQGLIWTSESFSVPRYIDGPAQKKIPSKISNTVEGQKVWYESFDGEKIFGWLFRCKDLNAPLVIECHGGPTWFTKNAWAPYSQLLQSCGFNVFSINFRGSTSCGSHFKNLNIGDLGGGDLKDLLWGARHVSKMLEITTKPAITGRSYGGFLTLMALSKQPDDWAGGVAFVPPIDMAEWYSQADAHYRHFHRHFNLGTPDQQSRRYFEGSPIHFVQNIKSPLLIIHGENDSICAIDPVREYAKKAKKNGVPVNLVEKLNEGHGTLDISEMEYNYGLSVVHLKKLGMV